MSSPAWRQQWTIGIFAGDSPLSLAPPPGRPQPVFSAGQITGVPATSVADPFLLWRGGAWHLFFELWNTASGRGEIGHAQSPDGFHWSPGTSVLREPFHLSYPCVVECEGEIYLIPETRAANAIRLYRALEFPHRWTPIATLAEGPFADPTVFRHQDHWWMFAQRGLDELRLFGSPRLDAQWTEHPMSPVRTGNRRITRPGGRVVTAGGRLLRFAQDGLPSYGRCLRALEIEVLTERHYQEREISESPVFTASGRGWNATAMHHLDAQPLPDGTWIGAVDGATLGYY